MGIVHGTHASQSYRPSNITQRFGQVRIAVVDYFEEKTTDIDGDGVPDLSHGDMVQRLIRSQLPDAEIHSFLLPGPAHHIDPKHVTAHFKAISKQMSKGDRFDAINLSIATMSKLNALPHSPDVENRRPLLQWLLGKKIDDPFQFKASAHVKGHAPLINTSISASNCKPRIHTSSLTNSMM